jgi:hypothetical protein
VALHWWGFCLGGWVGYSGGSITKDRFMGWHAWYGKAIAALAY